MPEEQQAQTPTAQPQAPATPPAGASPTETPAQEQTVPYTRFKEINDQLKALKDEADKQAKARQAADEQKLAQEAEWQKLADTRKSKIDELEPQAKLATALTEMVTAQYQADIKDWPEQVRAMAPSEDASILTKLEWMAKAKPLALELLKDKAPVPGNGPRPKPAGAAGSSKPAKVEPIIDVRRNF